MVPGAKRVPWGIVLLPVVVGTFYQLWTMRHEYVHDGAAERLSKSSAAREEFQRVAAERAALHQKTGLRHNERRFHSFACGPWLGCRPSVAWRPTVHHQQLLSPRGELAVRVGGMAACSGAEDMAALLITSGVQSERSG
eukprot:CAMPEP_0182921236 /NCGR_PEP_ID=MMETSP0105_2-20130417/4018_1 /TAXON_ID=81532 ORGANISM="Acanthoeca-like sp., Strain 10tr" /NCGR_SAMPLE_ID=MMETSP0105_2 /ASSEMBLY_ACC=CAM_ASM_000205 /LENGTH=138 /DNA_ID=CAMNT_0025058739 /DNA_START=52 /DNA_END=465 /DNA_ORIENTATION=-